MSRVGSTQQRGQMNTNQWQAEEFTLPESIPTMLSTEEVRYLYWLGRSAWDGKGILIEIGPWLGGSTACLAAGMQASGKDTAKRLKVFDNFIWREFMATRADLPLKPGDSFQPFFLENMKEFLHIVDSYARALPDEIIPDDREAEGKRFKETGQVPVFEKMFADPISILFIDGAKSWHGMLHLLKTLIGELVENQTLLVCQDFKYWGTYWVPVMMVRLKEYLEPVHNVLDGTTVSFNVRAPIPPLLLDSFETEVSRLDREQTLRQIDYAVALLKKEGDLEGAVNVSLAKVSFLSHQGRIQDAVQEFKGIQKKWPLSIPVLQLERVRTYLAKEKNISLPRPLSHRLSAGLKRIKRKLG